MARGSNPKHPLEWHDVRSDDGASLGRYAVDGSTMVVRSVQGWEKRTRIGGASHAALARMMLTEGPPPFWPPR